VSALCLRALRANYANYFYSVTSFIRVDVAVLGKGIKELLLLYDIGLH